MDAQTASLQEMLPQYSVPERSRMLRGQRSQGACASFLALASVLKMRRALPHMTGSTSASASSRESQPESTRLFKASVMP